MNTSPIINQRPTDTYDQAPIVREIVDVDGDSIRVELFPGREWATLDIRSRVQGVERHAGSALDKSALGKLIRVLQQTHDAMAGDDGEDEPEIQIYDEDEPVLDETVD